MLSAIKDEDIVNRVGGRFKLASLIQKRWKDLLFGARPMVEPGNMTLLQIAVQEIVEGKIEIDYDKSGIEPPKPTS
ncbi:MAG: DNA-directed RNA polymerase subunit omega [Phycisphaerae bacterium]